MFPCYSEVAKDHSRKRKITEVGNTSTDPFGFNLNHTFLCQQPKAFYPGYDKLLKKPFKSFTALLNSDSDDDDDDDNNQCHDENADIYGTQFRGPVNSLDQLIEYEEKKLQCMRSEARARATQKLEEKNAQMMELLHNYAKMEEQVKNYKSELELRKRKMKKMEEKVKYLEANLKEVMCRPGDGHEGQDESSFVDTQRHEETWISCKVCEIRDANIMVWPCKHLCVCRRCSHAITKCPVCKGTNKMTVEVRLPQAEEV